MAREPTPRVRRGSTVLKVATVGFPRKSLLLALTGVFVLGNALAALALGYGALMPPASSRHPASRDRLEG